MEVRYGLKVGLARTNITDFVVQSKGHETIEAPLRAMGKKLVSTELPSLRLTLCLPWTVWGCH